MDSTDRIVLKKLRSLLSERIPIYRMMLYGSRAKGEAETFSDMDVAIIADIEVGPELRDFISDCAWEAGYEFGIVIVPVVFSTKEWKMGLVKYSLLAKAIRNDGIPV